MDFQAGFKNKDLTILPTGGTHKFKHSTRLKEKGWKIYLMQTIIIKILDGFTKIRSNKLKFLNVTRHKGGHFIKKGSIHLVI